MRLISELWLASLSCLIDQDDVSVVKSVEFTNDVALLVWNDWSNESGFHALDFVEELAPSSFNTSSVLLDLVDLGDEVHVSAFLGVVADLLESLWINVSKDVSQSREGVLEHIVPVILGQVNNDWNQDRESLALVMLQDGEEEIVLEEAHSSVRHLQVRTGDGLDQSLEELLDVRLELGDVTDIQNFEQLLEEHSLLSEIGEWPVSQKSFNKLE